LSDVVDHGITVTEIASMDQPIDACPETTAAFVGRALRGPLNTPVLIKNFGEFRRRFGDVWGRSSLGPAAKQFFDHGGARLYVVRVANNARGAMLCLPASGSALVLRAIEPGSTELIRAAVDYDGIDDDNDDLFNLTLQRVNPGSGLVMDQEFFTALSWQSDSESFAADELLTSEIARAEQPYPTHRPERTIATGRNYDSTYIGHAQSGTDGSELSNYDLVGSRREQSGLFALEQIEHFDLLYLPPPGKGRDAGPAAILAAEMYSRERSAMLIVDPLLEWSSAAEVIDGTRELGYASPNLLGYFPRVRERGNEDEAARVVGGAIAGLLCKQDRSYGVWQSLDQAGLGLNRRLRPATELPTDDERLLVKAGINVIRRGPVGRARVSGAVTMGRGSEAYATFSQLPVRRLCLQIINTIVRATRWAVFEPEDDSLAERLRSQILTYLDCLNDLGAFADESFIVQCDAGVSNRADSKEHGVTILLVFHPVGSDEPVSLTLHQTASGFRVGSTAFGLTIRNTVR
jgi:phage tail sheath protein FI